MVIKTILNKNQRVLLNLIACEKIITDNFYFGGGTVLAEYYLHHRYSEDLDFFSEKEFDSTAIFALFKKIKKTAGIKSIDFQQSFNRNLFFLLIDGQTIKTEFTYFPFPRIKKGQKIDKLEVDSLLDIAVNKIFTVYRQPRVRDFIDLYFICKKESYVIDELIKKAKIKFDWHVDPLQLGAQFLQVKTVKDFPRMIIKIKPEEWQNFFINEANKLKKDILE